MGYNYGRSTDYCIVDSVLNQMFALSIEGRLKKQQMTRQTEQWGKV